MPLSRTDSIPGEVRNLTSKPDPKGVKDYTPIASCRPHFEIAEQVALIPQCAECGEVWLPADEDRWRCYLDTNDELVFYCPGYAEREFGSA